MEISNTLPIAEFKKQNSIETLFIIKTSKFYKNAEGVETSTNKRYASLEEGGEPYLWLSLSGAEAYVSGRKDLTVSTIKTDEGKTLRVITASKRQTEGTL